MTAVPLLLLLLTVTLAAPTKVGNSFFLASYAQWEKCVTIAEIEQREIFEIRTTFIILFLIIIYIYFFIFKPGNYSLLYFYKMERISFITKHYYKRIFEFT